MIDLTSSVVGLFVIVAGIIFFESRKRIKHCSHLHTRCLHGDEINQWIKVYILRFWKQEVVRRQSCLNCGIALDRPAICTATGEDLHEWTGPWVDRLNTP
jgi:hypothetical protein